MAAPRDITLRTVLLDTLSRFFANDIEVSVNSSEISFRRGSVHFSLLPIVTLSAVARSKVLSVGERISAMEPVVEIALFDPRSRGPEPRLKSEWLEAFFRSAFSRLTGGFVRPRVVFRISSELSDRLCGFEAAVFEGAALAAGARECVFRAA